MSDAITFVREDTGEEKEFAPETYRLDTETMHDVEFRSYELVSCYRSADGGRIDRMPDGRFQDKWKVVWRKKSQS